MYTRKLGEPVLPLFRRHDSCLREAMQTSTMSPRPKKPEIQDWENEGGATRPPREHESLSERVEGTVRTLPQRVTAAVQQQPLIALAAALGMGLLLGSRMRGPAGSVLRLASKPLLLGAAKALWTRFSK
jgi:hypothetical protein